jgi:predicted acetyltransferase
MKAWEDYLLYGNLGVFISIETNSITNNVESNMNIDEEKFRNFGVSRHIARTIYCDSKSKYLI